MPLPMTGQSGSESRTAEFATGIKGSNVVATSLEAKSADYNAKNPKRFSPNSVLQPYMLSAVNGNSASDAARQTPSGQLPSMNGIAPSTYYAQNPASFSTHLPI